MEDISTALRERRCIRRYRPDPVARELIEEILEEARWAPSAGNTQSTYVYVVTDAALEKVKALLVDHAEREVPPAPDIPSAPMPPYLQARMAALFKERADYVADEERRLGLTGEKASPPAAMAMARLFGAPVLLLLAADEQNARDYGCLDAGLFAANIALAARARGLGTCLLVSTLRASVALHKVLPHAEGKSFIIAMTLGIPDPDAAINRFPRNRLAVEEFTTFIA